MIEKILVLRIGDEIFGDGKVSDVIDTTRRATIIAGVDQGHGSAWNVTPLERRGEDRFGSFGKHTELVRYNHKVLLKEFRVII